MKREPGLCQGCGGPKPAGQGRRYCDRCAQERAANVKQDRREYARQYYAENRERISARNQAKWDADPDGYRKRKTEEARRWAAANPEKARANRRRHWAKRKYGMTLEEVEAILVRGCAICGTKEGSVVGPRGYFTDEPKPRLCLDHDHANGRVRDALCHSCNTGLGSFRDSPDLLRAAAVYIENHRKEAGQLKLP